MTKASTGSASRRGRGTTPSSWKEGTVVRAYTAPPEGCRVICIDELGPLAKTYPGEQYVPGERRATFEPDYGRRGKLWVHGAFEPATGESRAGETAPVTSGSSSAWSRRGFPPSAGSSSRTT